MKRLRRGLLAMFFALFTTVSVGASTGVANASDSISYGPWSCGPDQNVSITLYAPGVTVVSIYSSYETIWGQTLKQITLHSWSGGYKTFWAPNWGRTIYWYDHPSNVRFYGKSCR